MIKCSRLLQASIKTISEQDAMDHKFFGPVYHGSTEDTHDKIKEEGFKVIEGDRGDEGISNGYQRGTYANGLPPPVHHLGYGAYFTTVKAIGKQFANGTMKGVKTFCLDVPRLCTINFGSPNTMMKWWIQNGYDQKLAKTDRVAATKALTEHLKAQYDAVWFKGSGMHRLLDGDQIVVFDPSRVYMVDNSSAKPFDIGSKVRRKSDGMRGLVLKKESLEGVLKQYPGAASWIKEGAKFRMNVRWAKGGTDFNVQDIDVDPI